MFLKKLLAFCVFLFVTLSLMKNVYGQYIQFNDNPNIYVEGLVEGYGTSTIINTMEMCCQKKNYVLIRDHVNELIQDKKIEFMVRLEIGHAYDSIYSSVWVIEILDGANYIIMTDVYKYYYKVHQMELNQEVINDIKETLFSNNILQLKSNIDNTFIVKDPSVYYISVLNNKEKNQFAVISPFAPRQNLNDSLDLLLSTKLDYFNMYVNIINKIKNILEDLKQYMYINSLVEYMNTSLNNRGDVMISDEYLEKEIRIALDKSEGVLSISELETIEVIISNSKDISNLKGIEYLRNLRVLVLQSSRIEDIKPLENLYNLEVLKLINNNIKDISALSNLKKLEELNLNKNNITNIEPLRNLENLQLLSLSNNKISDISPLLSNVNLMDLDLSYNKIIDISSLQNLDNLNELNLSFNFVEELSPLSGLKNLKGLRLMGNNIKSVCPLKHLYNLEYMIIYNNPVDDFDCLSDLNVLIYREK